MSAKETYSGDISDKLYLDLCGGLGSQLTYVWLDDKFCRVSSLHFEDHAVIGSVDQIDAASIFALGIKFLTEVNVGRVNIDLLFPILLI